MSIEQAVEYINLAAGQDLSAKANDNTGVLHKAVLFDGTIASSSIRAAGIIKGKAPNGGNIRVATDGWAKAYIGAAVTTIGYPLMATTSGFLIACTSGSYALGRAVEAASSGDLRPVSLQGGAFYYAG